MLHPDTQSAVTLIQSLKTAMIVERRRLFRSAPWSVELMEQIDHCELSYIDAKREILMTLSPCQRQTAIRKLSTVKRN